jgi:hypothetical protein
MDREAALSKARAMVVQGLVDPPAFYVCVGSSARVPLAVAAPGRGASVAAGGRGTSTTGGAHRPGKRVASEFFG